jgi:hypothetical protein
VDGLAARSDDPVQRPARRPEGDLFVVSTATHSVLEYNGTTGAFVGTFVTAGSSDLFGSNGLTLGPNGDLFVTSGVTGSVLEYNGTTGAFVRTFASGGGLKIPTDLASGPPLSVPEPSGVVLLATGLARLGLGYVRRRRTRPRPATGPPDE